MAVKTNITINIVEPGSDVPVPDTGLFTHGIGNAETTIIVSAALVTVLVILSIVLTTYMYRKHKKQGRTTKLVHIIDQTKVVVKSKKRVTIGLSIIALLVSACTFTAFMLNTNNSNTSAIEGNDTEQQTENTEQTENTNNLTINAESKELTIEVKDQPVFAVLPVQVTVEEATQAGYTLTAYTDNTDLVSTTNPNNKIPMVTVEGDELTSLEDNTWGLALDNEPEAKDNKVYTTLSTDQTNPTLITDKDYEETEANDTTTIYYGFYITPDMPYGTYTGGEVEYEATQNRTDLATVIFDGNGLYFNNDPGQTRNVVRYEKGITNITEVRSRTENVDIDGLQHGVYQADLNKTFVYSFSNAASINVNILSTGNKSCCGPDNNDYFSIWNGNHADYTARSDYDKGIKALDDEDGKYVFGEWRSSGGININYDEIKNNNSITIAYTTSERQDTSSSGYGYYAIVTAKDINGNAAFVFGNMASIGEYEIPNDTFIGNHRFLGWDTNPNATYGTYANESDIAANLALGAGEKVTLYAIWQPVLSIVYNGNNADSATNMDNVDQYTMNLETTSRVDLLASNFQRKGYGFVGWSLDPDAWGKLTDNNDANNPTIYGPNQNITIDESLIEMAGESKKLIMYAVWAPAETTNSEDPVTLQDWHGCNNLTATIYDSATGILSVGKNTITALTDNRDGNVYAVARLTDGNCWMIENLRLDNEAVISTTNTNNPVTIGGNVTIKNNDNTLTNHLSPSSENWCRDSDSDCIGQSYFNNNVGNVTISPIYKQDFTNGVHDYKSGSWDESVYSYGNYYNWYSTTAGSKGYGSSGYGDIASGSICPHGWMLPYGGSGRGGTGETKGNTSGGYYYLNLLMGGRDYENESQSWRSFPNNFIYSGYIHGSNGKHDRGAEGHYWTSDNASSGENMTLKIRPNNSIDATNYDAKWYGNSVRCVMRQ